MVILLVLMTAALFVSIELIRDYRAKNQDRVRISPEISALSPVADTASETLKTIKEPEGLFYSPTHTWAFLEMNGKVKIGIDNFLQRIIGEIDKIEVCCSQENTAKGSPAITLKSGGRFLKTRIPIDGVIEAVNEKVLNNPGILLSDSYKDGWILSLNPTSFLANIRSMIFGKNAQYWLSSEMEKLKTILTQHPSAKPVSFQTMCDGGLPVLGVSGLIDDKLWETIKKEFFGDEN